MSIDVPPEITKHTPGVLGAISAMIFMREPWLKRIAMVFPGSVLSYYASHSVSVWSGMPEGLAGYLLGLFGMAFVAKAFDTWSELDVGAVLGRWLSHKLGVDDKEPPA